MCMRYFSKLQGQTSHKEKGKKQRPGLKRGSHNQKRRTEEEQNSTRRKNTARTQRSPLIPLAPSKTPPPQPTNTGEKRATTKKRKATPQATNQQLPPRCNIHSPPPSPPLPSLAKAAPQKAQGPAMPQFLTGRSVGSHRHRPTTARSGPIRRRGRRGRGGGRAGPARWRRRGGDGCVAPFARPATG